MREYVIKATAAFVEHLLRDGTQAARPDYMPADLRVVTVVQHGDIIKLIVETDEDIPAHFISDIEDGRPLFVPTFKLEPAAS